MVMSWVRGVSWADSGAASSRTNRNGNAVFRCMGRVSGFSFGVRRFDAALVLVFWFFLFSSAVSCCCYLKRKKQEIKRPKRRQTAALQRKNKLRLFQHLGQVHRLHRDVIPAQIAADVHEAPG